MMTQVLCEKRDNGVWLVTLNLPQKLNAISRKVAQRLREIYDDAKNDATLRVFVLTGSGRAFCAGGNLKPTEGVYDDPNADMATTLLGYYHDTLGVRELDVPTVAAINGVALGAGLCLALACDVRFAASGAKIGFNFAKLGLHPGMDATFLLTRTVGYAKAAEIFFSGELMRSEKAHQIGLINGVFAKETLLSDTLAWADNVAKGSLPMLKNTKQTLRSTSTKTELELMQREADIQSAAFAGYDVHEGIRAVFEKREPRFEDR